MSSFPFYSPQAREALVKIISNHPDDDQSAGVASSASPSSTNRATTTTLRPGTAIRGKWGGYDSSSDDDGGGINDAAGSDDESTSSSSSMEVIQESEEFASVTATATQQPQKGKSAHKPNKKSKNRKSKDDILQKIGKAPSILLPIHDNSVNTVKKKNSANKNEALEVPNVLLPPNYLRDNPSWKTPSIAKSLLKTWDQLNNATSSSPTIIVVLLQSGRFAAGVFSLQKQNKTTMMKMLAHKTSTRYTVRKGQGGSQSSHDQSKGKAKSVGSQLRREGEKQLRGDVQSAWKDWHNSGYVQRALWVYVSCPKGMKRDYLFGGGEDGNINDALVEKSDGRLRNIPLDVGRPSMEGTAAVVDCVLNCSLRGMTEDERNALRSVDGDEVGAKADSKDAGVKEEVAQVEEKVEETLEPEAPPLNPLHQAVLDGDLGRLMELLKVLDETEDQNATPLMDYDINTTGGLDNQTPLHLASSSSHANATSILNALLAQGHANPCALDARGRPPYFLATSDKNRETFRLARGKLGEDYCSWDDEAKVGPPLTEDDVQAKKAKALEKKRRQRARQKEKKANEKAVAEEEAAAERAEEEKKKREQDAKRIRDGLKPKSSAASNACDFCQKVVKGKRRSQMFQRLDYAYCSTDCVKKHQRELMAAAAAARMG